MKTATLKTDPALASMILSVSMAIVSISYLIFQRTSKGEPLIVGPVNTSGIALAALAGISLAGANIFLAFSYKAGGMAGLVSLLQNAISISLTILVGVLFLNEDMKPQQMVGTLLAMAGVFLISRG